METNPPAAAGEVDPPGRLMIRRARGEAIDIAIAAGLGVRVQVMEIDGGQVRLLCIAPKQVRFRKLTRQEAGKDGRRRRA